MEFFLRMLFATVLFLLICSCFVTINVSANSKDDPNRWMVPEKMAHRVNPVNSTQESIQRGKGLYVKHCTLCHGPEARGAGPAANTLKPRPTNLVAMAGMHEDGDVAWKIAEGRGVMPGWKVRLTEEQIWDLVNFIQSLKEPANKQSSNDIKKQ